MLMRYFLAKSLGALTLTAWYNESLVYTRINDGDQ